MNETVLISSNLPEPAQLGADRCQTGLNGDGSSQNRAIHPPLTSYGLPAAVSDASASEPTGPSRAVRTANATHLRADGPAAAAGSCAEADARASTANPLRSTEGSVRFGPDPERGRGPARPLLLSNKWRLVCRCLPDSPISCSTAPPIGGCGEPRPPAQPRL